MNTDPLQIVAAPPLRAALAGALFLAVPALLSAQRVAEVATGDASGEPDDLVEVPVRASFTHPLVGFTLGLAWGAGRLELPGWEAEGTASAASDPARRTVRSLEPGSGAVALEPQEAGGLEIPPGDDVLIAKVLFEIVPAAAPGRASVRPMGEVDDPIPSAFQLLVGGRVEAVKPERHVGSIVEVRPRSGPPRPQPVADLRCEQWLDRIPGGIRPDLGVPQHHPSGRASRFRAVLPRSRAHRGLDGVYRGGRARGLRERRGQLRRTRLPDRGSG